MRALKRPNPEHIYDSAAEIIRLQAHRDQVQVDRMENRNIPVPTDGHVLLASWNIANLGVHKRRKIDLEVIAEILSWFEIIAVQEVADNLNDFLELMELMPDRFRGIFSDRAGNDERSAFIYDSTRVDLGPKIGEVVIVESDRKHIKLGGIDIPFDGFNRNPYLATFWVRDQCILLANCHLLYGPSGTSAEKKASMHKRQLEAYAIARWCDLRRDDKDVFSRTIIALGDFNLPHAVPGDPIHRALTKRGLTIPPHETRIPTNVSDTYDYDQILVVPHLSRQIADMGVFDFDAVIFGDLWDPQRQSAWRTSAKYYISDHRPIWMQLALPAP